MTALTGRPTIGRVTAALAVLVMTATILVTLAAPAAAHGRASDATNFASEITRDAGVQGVTWQVYGNDERLAVRNTTGQELLVLGYEGEPYLRIGPDGVFENRRSPAAYLNDERYVRVPAPAQADPDAEPEWVKIGDRPVAAWHDHRIHWMAATLPAPVKADAARQHTILNWSVPFHIDGERLAIDGRLLWVPPPPAWPWLLAALAVTSLAAIGLFTAGARAPNSADASRLVRPAAVTLALIAVLDGVHLVNDLFAVPAPAGQVALAAGQTAAFLAVGLFGAWRAWQGRDGAFTALAVGAGALFLGQGLLLLPALRSSQLASVVPAALVRAAVAASIAQIVPVGLVAAVGMRRLLPAADQPPQPATTGEVARSRSG